MIAKISHGARMRGLADYLFGPGRHNEHTDAHLVAGYDGCEHSAPPELWRSEPGTIRNVRAQARAFGGELEYPRWRWDTAVPGGHVWHCSLSLRPDEGPLTDEQWGQAARMLVEALGFTGPDGKAPCRWAAVRHGPSAGGNDHVHVTVCLVREDGTKASTWQERRKASRACTAIEERLGLDHLIGRVTGRSIPEASRADIEISARDGDGEPARHRLERKVRAIAAASSGEADFVALARAHGLLVRPRLAPGGREVTGYSVAEEKGRQAPGSDGRPGPVWFGGSSLAADLSLPRLRQRWQPGATADSGALDAWTAVAQRAPAPGVPAPSRAAARPRDEVTAADVAGLLAAAATGLEPGRPGALSKAARHMARAAQSPAAQPAPADKAEMLRLIGDILRAAASPQARQDIQFMTTMLALGAGIGDRAVQGARDRAEARTAMARHGQQPGTGELLRDIAGEYLAVAVIAGRQGGAPATVTALAQLTAVAAIAAVTPGAQPEARRAASLTAQYASTAASPPPQGQPAPPLSGPAAVASDDALRTLLAGPLWQRYTADPRRAGLAALLDRAKAQGHDPAALLADAVSSGPLDAGAASHARSIAAVLRHRVGTALDAGRRQASAAGLPPQAAEALTRSAAPYDGATDGARRTDPAEPQRPPAARPDRQRDGRDSR
jgi:hypothetical protein